MVTLRCHHAMCCVLKSKYLYEFETAMPSLRCPVYYNYVFKVFYDTELDPFFINAMFKIQSLRPSSTQRAIALLGRKPRREEHVMTHRVLIIQHYPKTQHGDTCNSRVVRHQVTLSPFF